MRTCYVQDFVLFLNCYLVCLFFKSVNFKTIFIYVWKCAVFTNYCYILIFVYLFKLHFNSQRHLDGHKFSNEAKPRGALMF